MRERLDDQDAFSLTIPAMGSMIDLRWVSSPGNDPSKTSMLAEELQANIDRWVEVMSDYQQDSQVNELCRKADDGQWHKPSSDLWRVLMLCDSWNRWSQGAFDASLGALTRLRRSKKEPSASQWQQASSSCGWDLVEWDHEQARLRFKKPGLRFDFGAIGKGFVVDRLAERLQQFGIDRYSVNASGNMAFGDSPKPGGEGWPVAIGLVDHPDRSLCTKRLFQCGIATSGDLHQKYRDRPGQKDRSGSEQTATSSHIVDPAKQMGLQGSVMATVITSDATHSDALATACCVHAARGTLRGWLSRLTTGQLGYEHSVEIWVQSLRAQGQTPTLIHWGD